MAEQTRSGRHRGASRYNPVAELASIARAAGHTGAKTSAVLAASGGLVAAFALPAQAAPRTERTEAASAADLTAFKAPAAANTPAVVAPQGAAPVAPEPVGVVGVKAVAKPEPEPVVEVATQERTSQSVSRSSSRTSTSSSSTSSTSTNNNVAQSSSGIVNIARGLLGIPYVYGGTTPSGFDCSGFTSYVYRQAGISIPRTASQQQAAATRVSNPQPGDLVFFGSPAWHVAIYTGPGTMIDSPRPGKSTSERAIFSGVSGYGRF